MFGYSLCFQQGLCFNKIVAGEKERCLLLSRSYKASEQCPFQKTYEEDKQVRSIEETEELIRRKPIEYKGAGDLTEVAMEWDRVTGYLRRTEIRRREKEKLKKEMLKI